jgi:hypothetical protein
VTVGDYFPGIDRVLRIARVWPRIFAEDSGRTLTVVFEDDRLVVRCAGSDCPR